MMPFCFLTYSRLTHAYKDLVCLFSSKPTRPSGLKLPPATISCGRFSFYRNLWDLVKKNDNFFIPLPMIQSYHMITSDVALKEWAVVVEGLASGDQLLLIRKGGIRDPKGAFQLEHREFLLYPTSEHQKKEFVRPPFQEKFVESFAEPADPQSISFSLYAGVAFCGEVRTPSQLAGLEKYHLWTPEFLEERMEYRPQSPTLVVLVRAFRLSLPIQRPVKPEYAGCKSWVNLAEPVPVEGAEPVVENRRFRQALEDVAARLG